MKRLPGALALVAALAVASMGLGACNVRFSPYAAVVNGSEISQQQVQDAMSTIAGNSSYRCTIVSGGTARVSGAGDGTYNSAFGAEVLSILVQDKVVEQERMRLGLAEPAGVDSIALSQLQSATTPASGCTGTGASVMAAFSASYRRQLLAFQVDEDALAAHIAGATLVPSGLAGFVAANQGEMSLACTSVIEVSSTATASSLRAQIVAGASFAAIAKAHSLDTSSAPQGGAVGCIPDSEFSAPLNKDIASLPVGQVSPPITFGNLFLLLLVTSRQQETYAQQVASLLVLEQNPLGALITRLVHSAKVEVDPQYGSWSRTSSLPRVKPNAGPPARIVPNPSASTGPKASS